LSSSAAQVWPSKPTCRRSLRANGRDVGPAKGKPSGQKVGQAGQESPGGVLLFSLPEDRDFAAAGLKADAERVLDGPEVFVSDSEERGESGFGQGYGVIRFRNRLCSLRR